MNSRTCLPLFFFTRRRKVQRLTSSASGRIAVLFIDVYLFVSEDGLDFFMSTASVI